MDKVKVLIHDRECNYFDTKALSLSKDAYNLLQWLYTNCVFSDGIEIIDLPNETDYIEF